MNTSFFGLGLILTIIISVFSSWILIHILAVFGVFLAFAYPIWWLFAPKQTVCLLCRAEKDGDRCPFCRQTIIKSQGTSPNNLVSAVLNGGLILLFSIVSIGIVYGESQILFKLGFPHTPKTASFIIPSKGQYRLGEIFPMKIEVENLKNSINTVQADIGFDSTKVEIVDVSTLDSFANIFIQKEMHNEGGWTRLTGGLPNPGFFGNHGTFGTIYFRGKTPGLVKIEFLASSMVLANDGRGTNILKDLPSVTYLILPDRISDEEEIEQQQFISNLDVLGVSTVDNGQLKFYEKGSILGVQTDKEVQESKEFNIGSFFLGILEAVDRLTLTFWGKLLLQ